MNRARRRELKRAVERAADYADQKLREALEQGWIDATTLPEDVQQRLAVLEGKVLQGKIVGDMIKIEGEEQDNRGR